MGSTTTATRTAYGHNAASYAAQFGRPLGDAVREYAAKGGDMSPAALAAALDLTRTAAKRAARRAEGAGESAGPSPARSRGAMIATTGGVIIAETRHVDIAHKPDSVPAVDTEALERTIRDLRAELADTAEALKLESARVVAYEKRLAEAPAKRPARRGGSLEVAPAKLKTLMKRGAADALTAARPEGCLVTTDSDDLPGVWQVTGTVTDKVTAATSRYLDDFPHVQIRRTAGAWSGPKGYRRLGLVAHDAAAKACGVTQAVALASELKYQSRGMTYRRVTEGE